MRPYKVDVPVCVMIWTRPDYLRQQFEILREAAPSKLFLFSDGGRNNEECKLIDESRKIFENIDWECEVHRFFYDINNGMYPMMKIWTKEIWRRVDRCVFLEDDYVPAVSFFQYCAELLEKYKDDERIELICGNNPFGVYNDSLEQDYFFVETAYSIWGVACWKRTFEDFENVPSDYADDKYIKKCLQGNLPDFWWRKVKGYCSGEDVDGHVPGVEYFYATSAVLKHKLCIIPTRNMINNIGIKGTHANYTKGKIPSFFNLETYEMEFPMNHPKYFIVDREYEKKYRKLLGLKNKMLIKFLNKKFYWLRSIVPRFLIRFLKKLLG